MSGRTLTGVDTSPAMAESSSCVPALAGGATSPVCVSPIRNCHGAHDSPVCVLTHLVSKRCVNVFEWQVLKKSRRALLMSNVQTSGCGRVASDTQGQGIVLWLASSRFVVVVAVCFVDRLIARARVSFRKYRLCSSHSYIGALPCGWQPTMHAVPPRVFTHKHTRTQPQTCTTSHTHTHTHTHTQARTHSYTHTHTHFIELCQLRPPPLCCRVDPHR